MSAENDGVVLGEVFDNFSWLKDWGSFLANIAYNFFVLLYAQIQRFFLLLCFTLAIQDEIYCMAGFHVKHYRMSYVLHLTEK